MAGNHSLEIDGGVEWLQGLLVISFGVELKNFNLKLRYIFDLNE